MSPGQTELTVKETHVDTAITFLVFSVEATNGQTGSSAGQAGFTVI